CKLTADILKLAVKNGNMNLLQWLFDNNCEKDVKACMHAALKNNINLLGFLRINNAPWDKSTCNAAAYVGNFDMLQYAVDEGCDWDLITCINAAISGNIQIIQYCIDNNNFDYSETLTQAIKNNHLHVVEWLVSEYGTCDKNHLMLAVFHGNEDILDILLRLRLH